MSGPTPVKYTVLIPGFPGANVRGYLAWSSVVLVRTAERVILFDTGSSGDRPGVVAGVREAGLDLSDIDLVVLSHLHFDHAANAELFDAAEIAVHQAELDAATRHEPREDLARSRWHTEALLKSRIWPVQQARAQVADGVELWHTPGHTPGSLSLVLHTEEGIVILAGDTIKERRQLWLPPSVADDLAALQVSTDLIVGSADVIVPGHDVPLRRTGDQFRATEVSRAPLRYTVGWA